MSGHATGKNRSGDESITARKDGTDNDMCDKWKCLRTRLGDGWSLAAHRQPDPWVGVAPKDPLPCCRVKGMIAR